MFYRLFFVLLFCCDAFGNAVNRRVIRQSDNNACVTPGAQSGTCIRLNNCTYMQNILKTQRVHEAEIKTFLQKSQCGKDKDGTPKVCCYLDSINPPVLRIVSPTQNFPPKDYSKCGQRQIPQRIVGGSPAEIGDWPWIVAIGFTRPTNSTVTWDCGGSLISDRWVVTAGHCTKGIGSLILTSVRMGDLNLDNSVNDGASPVDIKVDRIITHPQYTSSPVANDIALLRLQNPVTFTEYIRPICIPKGDEYKGDGFYSGKTAEIAGWGHTQGFAQSKETRSNALLDAVVDTVEIQLCDQKYRSGGARASIDSRVLCAMRPGVDTCQGDSGGPMTRAIGASFHLIGIVSFGVGCANENFPGVYTKVAYFGDWIRNTTGLSL